MKKKIFWTIVFLVVLSFGYYAVSPLWRKIKRDDPLPILIEENLTEQKLINPNNLPDTSKIISPAPIVPTPLHPASGEVLVILGEQENFVRFQNYKTINGPDLYVYLAKDLEAKEFVDLGPIKATEGNVNYSVSKDVRIEEYPYVLTWCKRFGVLFNSAKIF